MYCRFCGAQIEDDSCFCAVCGKELAKKSLPESAEPKATESIEPKVTESDNANSASEVASASPVNSADIDQEPERSAPWGLLLLLPFVVLFLIIVIACAGGAGAFDVGGELKESDYSYTTAQDLTKYSITVTPTRNISQCDIELTLYNSSGKKLYSDTISKTKLKKNSSYTYTFDFGFVNSLSGNKVYYKITGKR